MRILVLIFTIFTLKACAPSGGGSPASHPPANPSPAPDGGRRDLSWGELSCQQRRDCQDPVLNQSLSDLEIFLHQDFDVPTSDFGIFLCGRTLGWAWEREFATSGFDPRLDDFFWLAIDPNGCRPRIDWKEKLNSYFKNHQEYKSEIH